MVHIHKWQDAGHGTAPFRFIALIAMPSAETYGMNVEGYNNAMRDAQLQAQAYGINGLGSCDVCGTGIHNHCVIRDATGKHFKVGCDCVAKTGDSKLITATENAERLRQKALREAKREAAYEAQRLASVANEDAERARNGGSTDREVAERDRLVAKAAVEQVKFDKWSVDNEWLLSVLKREYQGDFVRSMIEKLERMPVSDMSERCSEIVADIYAKSFGRRNSKKYNAAIDEFCARTEVAEEVEA